VLSLMLAVVVVGGILFKIVTKESFGDGAFRAYALLNNVPGADATCDETAIGRLVSNSVYMVGVATFAVIIGIVSDGISSSVSALRMSNERVQEVGHTVVVNWGAYTRPMLRQLEAARREGRLSGPVVILSGRDKEEMDAEVADELRKMSPAAGLEVITRHGSPRELDDVDRVATGTARRIIMLPAEQAEEGDDDDANESLQEATGLALALQRGARPAQQKRAAVVVAAPEGYHAKVADGKFIAEDGFKSYAEVRPEDFISRILAQCAVQPSLSRVYAELLLQGQGQELYTEPLAKHKAMHGASFGEASRRFGRAIPVGVVRAPTDGGEKEVVLSPPDEMAMQPADEMILLAPSREATRPGRLRALPKPPPTSDASDAGGTGAAVAGTQTPENKPPRILVLNIDPSMPDFIEQIDEVAPRGAAITIFCPEKPDKMPNMRRASVKYIHGDPSSPAELREVGAHQYDAVVLLQPGGGSDVDDSKLLITMLALKQAARADGAPVPRVVGEMHSPSMLSLLDSFEWPTRKRDFVLPNELCAGTLVQFALQPELRAIYSELLSQEGKEIVLRAARDYAPPGAPSGDDTRGVTFEQLCLGAREKGEVAIGVHLRDAELPVLNPPRDLRIKLRDGDKLVILGEAF